MPKTRNFTLLSSNHSNISSNISSLAPPVFNFVSWTWTNRRSVSSVRDRSCQERHYHHLWQLPYHSAWQTKNTWCNVGHRPHIRGLCQPCRENMQLSHMEFTPHPPFYISYRCQHHDGLYSWHSFGLLQRTVKWYHWEVAESPEQAWLSHL